MFAIKIIENSTAAALETAINAYVSPLAPTTINIQYQVVLTEYISGTYVISYSALITTT